MTTQNIYDDPEFFAGYSRLARSVEGLAGAPEWPALRALLPDLSGLRIVDLGCGFGWFCRWAREQGAAQVLGLDALERMLAQAKASTADAAIAYERVDLERLDLPEARFGLAYSSLVLHYIEVAAPLRAQIHRALVPGGRLVFSMEHPIYAAPTRPGWSLDTEGGSAGPSIATLSKDPAGTIGTTLNLLIRSGFTIRHVEEFCPTAAQIAADPALAEERERPMFLLVAAQR